MYNVDSIKIEGKIVGTERSKQGICGGVRKIRRGGDVN